MINSTLKSAYFSVLRIPMRVNSWVSRYRYRKGSGLKVHLGPGQRNYFPGWINVDANAVTAKIDLWANFLDPLPFPDGSVQVIYSHHVVEHLPDLFLPTHFRELYRILQPGGGIRVGVPHVGNACRKYVEQDLSWFSPFPDRRESIGGRLASFLFCRGEHLTALEESYLNELAVAAGFTDIRFCRPVVDTGLAELGIDAHVLGSEVETDFEFPHTLVLEARKQR